MGDNKGLDLRGEQKAKSEAELDRSPLWSSLSCLDLAPHLRHLSAVAHTVSGSHNPLAAIEQQMLDNNPLRLFFYDCLLGGISSVGQELPADTIVDWPQGLHGYVLQLTLDGEGLVRDREQSFTCVPGDLLLFPPKVPMYYHLKPFASHWVYAWIYFYPRPYWRPALNFPDAISLKPTISAAAGDDLRQQALKLAVPVAEEEQASGAMTPQTSADLKTTLNGAQATSYDPMKLLRQIAAIEEQLGREIDLEPAEQLQAQETLAAHYKGQSPEEIVSSCLTLCTKDMVSNAVGYFHVPHSQGEEFASLFKQVVRRTQSLHVLSRLLASNYLEQILLRRLELGLNDELMVVDQRVSHTCLYMQENISNPQFSIADIAAHSQLSTSRISHLFEGNTGMSIIRWRDQERLKLAKHLLLSTNMRMDQIAAQIGIQDRGYFFKFFKRNCGLTPNQYRRDVRMAFLQGAELEEDDFD